MKRTIAAVLTLLLPMFNLTAFAAPEETNIQGTVELRGSVVDETKAYIPGAPVVLDDGQGNKYTAQTDESGRYRFTGVKPGLYTLRVEVEGFAKFEEQIDLTTKRAAPLDITLKVFISDQLEVKNDSPAISTEPDKNLTAITLSEKDLESLPDDPDELLDTLRQMAGASGGPGEAAIYVGGFRERGRIPPKEAIQMIRINSNPFSAEFSETGFSRIEIVTKPGSDTFRGGFNFRFNDESLNARNAFSEFRAPLQTRSYGAHFSGPIIRNRWGFFLNMDRREQDENDVINATLVNPVTLAPEPFVQTVLVPTRGTNFEFRTDFLATKKHTLGFGYRFNTNEVENSGLGGFDLPERAVNRSVREDTLRFSLMSIASERAVNELRLQLSRRSVNQRAISNEPAIIVFDAFRQGGNQSSLFRDNTSDELEFADNVTYTHKKHTFRVGLRAEAAHLENIDRPNFLGTFTFGTDFERDESGAVLYFDASGALVSQAEGKPRSISALERYTRFKRGLAGYVPSQFSINRGDPFIGFSQWEMGWFAQDDWRVSPRLTLSYGFRHEFQTHLRDKLNFAPRFGLAWAADKNRKSTLRAGAGIFYNYLDTGITYDTIRLDGKHQRQFVVSQPTFFIGNIPAVLPERLMTTRIKAEDLNAPYSILSTVSYERQLPWKLIGSVAYTWNRGVHLLRTRNINAPLPGSSVRPFPDKGPILQYESTGRSNRHEMRLSLRTNISRRFSLFGNYILGRTLSDTDSANTTPANPFDLSAEYGRSGMDSRHQFFIGSSINLPGGFRVSPHIQAWSNRPFNITTGRDDNRDSLFTERPSFASPGDPGAVVTRFGTFNPTPRPGDEIIPRNFGQGPAFVMANLSISKTFGFGAPLANLPGRAANQGRDQQGNQQGQNVRGNNQGRRGDFGGRQGGRGGMGRGGQGGGGFGGPGGGFSNDSRNRYNLTLNININNLLNHTNLAGFNEVLTSPVFGTANRALESRRIVASIRFSF